MCRAAWVFHAFTHSHTLRALHKIFVTSVFPQFMRLLTFGNVNKAKVAAGMHQKL